jgi:hypothetical protein
LEAWPAHEEAQSLGLIMWMQERVEMWEARHEDEKLWRVGITNVIAKTMKGVAQLQKGRETEKEMTARMDGGGLESSQHADMMLDE